MEILTTKGWKDYELIDTGNGYRLERFGKFVLARPDPQIIWKPRLSQDVWQKADATFTEGKWKLRTDVKEKWLLKYKGLFFWAKLIHFKHTGVFPEQHIQWDWLTKKIALSKSETKILNLFAYTGISTLVAASLGAAVTHVDSSRPTIGWARDNQKASNLDSKPIRWILDDALKFATREVKRGQKYDAIIMDPPSFGHGPEGETWEFNNSFPRLMEICHQLLSDKPLFVLINTYAISSSCLMLENVLKDFFPKGFIEVGELVLEEKDSARKLSTGIFGRWSP